MQAHLSGGQRFAASLLSIGLMALAGCPAPRETAVIPPGAWLVGRAAPVSRVIGQLSALSGTPVGELAATAAARLAGCEHFAAHVQEGDVGALFEAIRCSDGVSPPEALEALRLGAALAFAIPVQGSARLVGRGDVAPSGSVSLEAKLEGDAEEGWLALLVPGEEPAGSTRLSGRESLLHARIRPAAGLDFSRAVPSASQADTLFRLKSRLFAGAVLGGSWEIAVYAPAPGEPVPGMALALDVAAPALAEPALREFVGSLEATWPIRHERTRIAGHDAACFPALKILPGFAPCYTLTGEALIIGWNVQSVVQALDATPEPGLPTAGGMIVHLDRLPDADARMQAAEAGSASGARLSAAPPLWDRLAVRADGGGGRFRWRVDLIARGDAT
jgi:hypothetical protein